MVVMVTEESDKIYTNISMFLFTSVQSLWL